MSDEGLEQVIEFITAESRKKRIPIGDVGTFWSRVGIWAVSADKIGEVETSGLGRLFYELG